MRCPFCGQDRDKVVDSRAADEGRAIRRRRECLACGKRYSTREQIEPAARVHVVKKDGSRVPYDRRKIAVGLEKACYKRPVSAEALDGLIDQVEEELFAQGQREFEAVEIGRAVALRLKDVDRVAYVRFASVYKQFRDLDDLLDEVRDVLDSAPPDPPEQGRLF